jgi:hypothetical protein
VIASFKHSFIFIKTMKTASTSVEFALSSICGTDDIVSPTGATEDVARWQTLAVLPRNFSHDRAYELRYLDAVMQGDTALTRHLLSPESASPPHCYPHMTAGVIKNWVGEDFWQRAVKITTERHPYEKVVSLASFVSASKRGSAGRSFDQIVESIISDEMKKLSGRFYILEGRVIADEFIRVEHLHDDFARVLDRLGLPPIPLPQRRIDIRRDKRPARDILSADQKRRIQKRMAQQFELFGWER